MSRDGGKIIYMIATNLFSVSIEPRTVDKNQYRRLL